MALFDRPTRPGRQGRLPGLALLPFFFAVRRQATNQLRKMAPLWPIATWVGQHPRPGCGGIVRVRFGSTAHAVQPDVSGGREFHCFGRCIAAPGCADTRRSDRWGRSRGPCGTAEPGRSSSRALAKAWSCNADAGERIGRLRGGRGEQQGGQEDAPQLAEQMHGRPGETFEWWRQAI
jgi:hypothetical protein